MEIALDSCMIFRLPPDRLPHAVAELGCDTIELSPRSDFPDGWGMPRATGERMVAFRRDVARRFEHAAAR